MDTIAQFALLTGLNQGIIKIIEALLDYFKKFFKNIFEKKKKEETSLYQTTIESKYYFTRFGSFQRISNDNDIIIRSILHYLLKNNIKSKKNKCNYVTVWDRCEREKDFVMYYTPDDIIEIDGIKITYEENVKIKNEEGDPNKQESALSKDILKLNSNLSGTHITKFIEKCTEVYNEEFLKINKKKTGFCFKQIFDTNINNNPLFHKYYIENNQTSFDDIFFNEKNQLLKLIDKVKNGEMQKLGILLYGPPGTGKTSIERAIAKYTNRSIVHINLSLITSNTELEHIFFSNLIRYKSSGEKIEKLKIENDKKIYVFEDIDAETDLVKKRECYTNILKNDLLDKIDDYHKKIFEKKKKEEQEENVLKLLNNNNDNDGTQDNLFSIYSKHHYNKLTLSGLLNVLDGVIEIGKAIYIMTTNKIELIDEAVIRYGRIHKKIYLGNMSKENAKKLIMKYFPKESLSFLNLKENFYNPAKLESLCLEFSHDFNQFLNELEKYEQE